VPPIPSPVQIRPPMQARHQHLRAPSRHPSWTTDDDDSQPSYPSRSWIGF
jgi:hypothetical protein